MMELPFGYLLQEDENLLLELSTGCALAVDLGTCFGRSAVILSQRAKRVITVDIFENIDLIKNEGSRAHYKNLFESHHHNYEDIKLLLSRYPNITVVQSLTHEYALTQNDNSVDIILLDADHSYTGLLRDLRAWFLKIRQGGLFLFHDATDENWDVKIFCDSFLLTHAGLVEIENAGCTRVFRKL